MSDEETDFSSFEKPEQIAESSLADTNFKKKLSYIQNANIDLVNAQNLHDVVLAFEHEHRSLIENGFRRGFDRRRDFLSEWERFNRYSSSPIYAGLKAAADESFVGFTEAYFYSLQALVYLSLYSDRLAQTALTMMNKGSGFSEESKRQFISDARALSGVAERMYGLSESMREKKEG